MGKKLLVAAVITVLLAISGIILYGLLRSDTGELPEPFPCTSVKPGDACDAI